MIVHRKSPGNHTMRFNLDSFPQILVGMVRLCNSDLPWDFDNPDPSYISNFIPSRQKSITSSMFGNGLE